MTVDPVSSPSDSPMGYVPPKPPVFKTLVIVVGVALLAIGFGVFIYGPSKTRQPVGESMDRAGPPAIVLRPSLIVPGPMQVPHPVDDTVEARPDEAIIFRVEITGSGYVLIALEAPGGALQRIHGGHPDEGPLAGSHLIADIFTGKTLAVALKEHKGKTLTFVAALSSRPWDPYPVALPGTPRTFPDPGRTSATSPDPTLLAWDRISVKVAKEVPVPEPVLPE